MKAASPDGHRPKLRELFEKASEMAGDEQAQFLENACKDEPELKAKLVTLLMESTSGESLLDKFWDRAVWPALESLRGDTSRLRALLEAQTGASDTEDKLVGTTVSHFKLLESIGKGGMGMVYKAHDGVLDRTVALKFLPPALGQDEKNKERFIHEAKTASALDHQNIGTVYEIGETTDGQLFIAMGYYPGRTLAEIIAEGPVALELALNYIHQLASALDKVHKKELVHRDIKPGNIIVTEDGTLKLLDFGLAKLSHEAGYTQVGEMLGTVSYMSPEQARGEPVDHRTDIWSMGVVLFEMLTGRRPFDGKNIQHAIQSVLGLDPWQDPELKGLLSGLPRAWNTLLRMCLAKDPDERYSSAGAFLEDLERVQNGIAPLARPRGFRRWPGYIWKSAGIATLAVALYVVILLLQNSPINPSEGPVETAGVTFTRINVPPFSNDPGAYGGIYWGDYDADGNVDLFVTGITPRLFHNKGDGAFVRVSPGGFIEDLVTDKGCSFGASWVDYDNDGDMDLYVGYFSNLEADPDRFYINNGDGTFTRQLAEWIPTDARTSISWADVDSDGLLDLFAGHIQDAPIPMLFRHQPDGSMVATDLQINWALGSCWSDYDLDGDVDLFIGGRPEIIYRNEGNFAFTKLSQDLSTNHPSRWFITGAVATADYDNDGDPDFVISNRSYNQLFRNDGEDGWTALDGNVIAAFKSMGSAIWGDYDNDGFVDLLITGLVRTLFHNEGDGSFTLAEGNPLTDEKGFNPCAAWADFDNDGDLDVVLSDGMRPGGVRSDPPQPLAIYRNDGGTNHWINLTLRGTRSNRSALGAKVFLEATINGTLTRQLREVTSAAGHTSQNDMRVHFGLGDAAVIERIRIEWPSGLVEELTNLGPNQFLSIVEGEAANYTRLAP